MFINDLHSNMTDVMIDSGAAVHVCPPWFATEFPLHRIEHEHKPTQMTLTNKEIPVFGYRRVHFTNEQQEHIVISFYVCLAQRPILSASRLKPQGFRVRREEPPAVQHDKFFSSILKERNGLF